MEHRDRQRAIFLGPYSQSILTPYLLRAEDQVCFVPQRRGIKAYSTRSYRDAIHRACDRAFPVPEGMSVEEGKIWQKRHRWNPNQIRHSAATEIRRKFGIEAVQCVLGHSEVGTAQIYAERDMAKAAEIMRQVG
jgi:site-specific recombinase XerD